MTDIAASRQQPVSVHPDEDAILARLATAGLMLPDAPPPAANYVPYTRSGSFLFVAGQTPVVDGRPRYVGIVGYDVTIDNARLAARLCMLNVLSQVRAALGVDFHRARCMRITGFIRCREDFTQQSLVLDGASDVVVLALGAKGRHARTAVGTNALPRHVPVEIEAIFDTEA